MPAMVSEHPVFQILPEGFDILAKRLWTLILQYEGITHRLQPILNPRHVIRIRRNGHEVKPILFPQSIQLLEDLRSIDIVAACPVA